MNAESEVEAMMIPIDTDKFQAIKTGIGAPSDATPSIVWDLLLDVLALYNIYHRGYGWVQAQLFKHDEKKVKQSKDVIK